MSTRIQTDWPLFTAILMLLCFGLIIVYSASSVIAGVRFNKETYDFALRQYIFASLGVLLMLILKRINYQSLRHPLFIFVPIGLVVLLLIGVLFFDPANHRWYRLPGGFKLQPSEFAKPVLILFLAYFVARRENEINNRHTLGPAAIVVAGLAGLIGYADLGTAFVILLPAAAVFYVAGLEKRIFILSMVLVVALAAGAIVQKPYRLIRILAYVGLTEEKIQATPALKWMAAWTSQSKATRDSEYHARQSEIAVGTGGLFGVGLNQGHSKMGFLPEAHTDFIFGVVGEELGLLGSCALICGYMVIFWRGLRLFWLAPDVFGRYLALGTVVLFAGQAFFNMSVVLGLFPTKGLPLPMISYGGSALLTTLASLGLLLSVSDHA